jgi:hypothetical protein
LILATAATEGRAVVTDNVRDFRPLAARAIMHRRSHAGLVYTTNQRFPRGDPRTLGRLVTALDELLLAGQDMTNRELWLS